MPAWYGPCKGWGERNEGKAYNWAMPKGFFDELKSYVGFEDSDVLNLCALAPAGKRLVPRVVARFYDVLLAHQEAKAVLTSAAQMERLRLTFGKWLTEIFSGTYDDAYLQSRMRIGHTHVRIALPQRFMPLAMEVVWRELREGLRESCEEQVDQKLISVHKILMLDLTIMLGSYHESHSQQVRDLEKRAMEARLLRTQHLAEIGQMAASLAHDIKNPLAGISGAIQIIGDTLDPKSPYKPIIGDILGQISRLDGTVKDLLLYARPAMSERKNIRIAEIVSRTISVLREEPALRNIHVRFNGTDSAVEADEGQLEQLLMNLILNAAHASRDGGTISVEVLDRGDRVELAVKDQGTGMPQEVARRALEPFFTTKTKGTGLGLAICRRIAESHGGSISIESEPGKGTTVVAELFKAESGGREAS